MRIPLGHVVIVTYRDLCQAVVYSPSVQCVGLGLPEYVLPLEIHLDARARSVETLFRLLDLVTLDP